MTDDREFELKFALEPADADALLSHAELRDAARHTRRTVSTYFDTREDTLRRQRVSLRVRRSGARTVQTLKHAGRSAVDRDEWEREGGGPEPDMAWLRGTPLASLFADDRLGRLERRFTVDVSRTTLPLRHDGAAIEGALDRGTIEADGRTLPVSEFELELKDGRDGSVVDLARAIARDVPLVLSLSTKAERGYAVAEDSWNRPEKTLTLDVARRTTLAEVFAAVVEACLHLICRNVALIRPADDAEAVHKTRIAVRHLRAALALFRPVLRRKASAALEGEVKWISDRLGAARDADVFRGETRDAPALAGVMGALREDAHEALRAALASSRWRLLLIDTLAFSMDGVRRRHRGRPAGAFVRRRLAGRQATLARRARRWSRLSAEDMHGLRKRAKMMRYALDLTATVPRLGAKPRRLRKLGAALQAMQEALGTVHDAIALREHLGEAVLRRDAPPGTEAAAWDDARAAAARLAGSTAQDNRALGRARKAARRLRRVQAF